LREGTTHDRHRSGRIQREYHDGEDRIQREHREWVAAQKVPLPWNRPITDADRRAARAAIEAERAGDDGAIFRFIDTPRKD
jgi:hypothetical protein